MAMRVMPWIKWPRGCCIACKTDYPTDVYDECPVCNPEAAEREEA